jgi:dinuclear metal center YbgI/SA1388 family protein
MARAKSKRRATSKPRPLLKDVVAYLDVIAPPEFAEAWDNVGLLAGDPEQAIDRIHLAIDVTPPVHDELEQRPGALLIAYHPPLFKPIKTLVPRDDSPPGLALRFAARGGAIYSPHTALDAAPPGTNDALCDALGLVAGAPLLPRDAAAGALQKLVTFIPAEAVECVADALFAAGCGTMGASAAYTRCSFRSSGTGTFHGNAASHPAVGKAGRDEHVPEVKFETIVPHDRIGAAIAALRRTHPYEEPAFDLIALTAAPIGEVGMGRWATLERPTSLKALVDRCRSSLKLKSIVYHPGYAPPKPIRHVAVIAGSGGTMALHPPAGRPDCFITGELKHHDQLAYAAAGIPVILLGHAASEQPVLSVLFAALRKHFPACTVRITRDPAVRLVTESLDRQL